jgi:hypothetical protein
MVLPTCGTTEKRVRDVKSKTLNSRVREEMERGRAPSLLLYPAKGFMLDRIWHKGHGQLFDTKEAAAI